MKSTSTKEIMALPRTYYVSKSGNNSNGRTPQKAFRTIQQGIDALSIAGDKLFIYGGIYTECVKIKDKEGTESNPIIIEGQSGVVAGPVVTLQGSITGNIDGTHTQDIRFHESPNHEWVRNTNVNAHPDEYVSVQEFIIPTDQLSLRVNRGAFIGLINNNYTRLITYRRLEDLRSSNELRMDNTPLYMGPGIWYNTGTRKIHIRLSHTHNNINGLADYTGETNPKRVPLSICTVDNNEADFEYTMKINKCKNLQFSNLSIRFGAETIRIENCNNLSFDQINIFAGEYGVRTGDAVTGLKFTNSVFDGGLPTWLFRSDLKDSNDPTNEHGPGARTLGSLVLAQSVQNAEFANCEFLNGHDLYITCNGVNFHHNWLHNLHDEALILAGESNFANGNFHHNVITKTIDAISFQSNTVGPWNIYRNLIDLREPIAGFRPKSAGDTMVWRFGRAFKNNDNGFKGRFSLFQNTIIVRNNPALSTANTERSPFSELMNNLQNTQPVPHRSFNNIFAFWAIKHVPTMSFEYSSDTGNIDYHAQSNGNLYYTTAEGIETPLKIVLFQTNLVRHPLKLSPNASNAENLSLWAGNDFFQKSRDTNPPGFEIDSQLQQDPKFVRWNNAMQPDSFWLQLDSPARRTGLNLTENAPDLHSIDIDALNVTKPDIGCYQCTAPGHPQQFKVGVQGRKVYPAVI